MKAQNGAEEHEVRCGFLCCFSTVFDVFLVPLGLEDSVICIEICFPLSSCD